MAYRVQPSDHISLLSSISQFDGTSNSSGALQISVNKIIQCRLGIKSVCYYFVKREQNLSINKTDVLFLLVYICKLVLITHLYGAVHS